MPRPRTLRLLAAIAVAFVVGRFVGRGDMLKRTEHEAPAAVAAPSPTATAHPARMATAERREIDAERELGSPDPATVAGDGRHRASRRLVADLQKAIERGDPSLAPTNTADIPAETAAEFAAGFKAALAERTPTQ